MAALPTLSVADEEVYPPPLTFTVPVGVPEELATATVTWSESEEEMVVLAGVNVTVGVLGLVGLPPPTLPPPPPQAVRKTVNPEAKANSALRAKRSIPDPLPQSSAGAQTEIRRRCSCGMFF
jgi:hypothetical protein